MSISTTSTCIIQKRKQQCLKPYDVSLRRGYIYSNHDYYEHMDMRDFRNASINKLTLSDYSDLNLNSKNKKYLEQLLSNTNIKVLNINGHSLSMKILSLFSYYISKNTTIQEIELDFLYTNLKIENPKRIYFIKAISSRLKRVHIKWNTREYLEFNKHLFSCTNIKEITFDYYDENKGSLLSYTLSTKMHLDYFYIKNLTDVDQHFFDFYKESNNITEINTLSIYTCNKIQCSLLFIKNAYLFNVQTIKIIEFNKKTKLMFEEILKLSRNPKNTVKKILLPRKKRISYLKIIQKLLLSGHQSIQYDIQKIPKIYIDRYEISINYDYDTNDYNVTSPYYNLPNDPIKFISCESLIEIDMRKYSNLNRQYYESIINQMKELYDNFKANYIHPAEDLYELRFYFNIKNPEINDFGVSILEFIIDKKYKVRKLTFIGVSACYLANFLEKHKALESLNIDSIVVRLDTLDLENIDRLYQYYYLITGKIVIDFKYYDDESKFIFFRNSRFKNNNNFVDIDNQYATSCIFFNSKDVIDYLEKIKNKEVMMNYVNDIIPYLRIDFDSNDYLDLKVLICLFSYFKEKQFIIKEVSIKFLPKERVDYNKKIRLMHLETILDVMYRINGEDPIPKKIRWNQFSKKIKRYCKGHNIRICKEG